MNVRLHAKRDDWNEMIGELDDDEVRVLNDELAATGAGFTLDPYGDTKLTDHHLDVIQKALQAHHPKRLIATFEKLKGRDVVYARGE